MNNVRTVIAGLIVLLVIGSLCFYTVDQRQYVIVFQLGEIVRVIKEPGWYLKLPSPIQNVRYFDGRLQTLDAKEPERFITIEKINVLVDLFVKWRIADVKQYYISVGGDERRAQIRLAQTINNDMRAEFGNRTVHQIVSGERDRIMETMRSRADRDARNIGVQVLDVRVKRVDYQPEVSESVYRRMEAERKRVANERRSEGFAESEKLRADAERKREVTIAGAYRDAQKAKGEGDAKAASIYAEAFNQDANFYGFYRSLDVYRSGFKNKNDLMLLDPNSEFFKYLKSPSQQK
ncbi:MAG: protease modulator HflC [Pseudomonadota bacterium]|nr:protease modulator HflC [Pseudomonadota bacterium]